MEAPELGRVVDEPVHGENRSGPRAHDPEPRSFPEHTTPFVHDARCVEHRTDLEAVQPAGHAERDEVALGDAPARANPDPGRAEAGPPRGALLGARGTGERQPVSVQAMLRTVSFTLLVAA